jgi:hypothetical protein
MTFMESPSVHESRNARENAIVAKRIRPIPDRDAAGRAEHGFESA